MRQALINKDDDRIGSERRLICRGAALVRFGYILWDDYIRQNEAKRRLDPRRVERIKHIFSREGCHSLRIEHHVPAIVDQETLDASIADACEKGRWKGGALPTNYAVVNSGDGYPELEFPGGIQCLHGIHRVQAGKEWLPLSEKWWIVDFYLSAISYELKTLLVEEYANEEAPCQGQIYRKIREYQRLPGIIDSNVSSATCVGLQQRWWARLNKSKERKLKSLLRNSLLPARFDTLARIPALFDAGMKITTLHEILATSCFEEIAHYLDYIWLVWEGFMKGVRGWTLRIDLITVQTIQLRSPGSSTIDAQIMHGQILGGIVFSSFSHDERCIIWDNIRVFEGIIPTLHTFFQDVILLRACVDGFKWLFSIPSNETLYTTMLHCYSIRPELGTHQAHSPMRTGQESSRMRLGYLVLMVFALQYHQELPPPLCKKNPKTIPRLKADPRLLQQFATLAFQQGFTSPEIVELIRDGQVPPISTPEHTPILVTTGSGEALNERCGRPHIDSFGEDRKILSLGTLCEERHEIGESITSFFVLRSWFAAFFDVTLGRRRIDGSGSTHQSADRDTHMGNVQTEVVNQAEEETEHHGDAEMSVTEHQRDQTARDTREEDNVFVPSVIHNQATGAKRGIRFVQRSRTENGMWDPFEEYAGFSRELRLDHGDPALVVAEQVTQYLAMGQRTCDRHKKHVSAEDCYDIATTQENNNTLFLIPDLESQEVVESRVSSLSDEHQVLGDVEVLLDTDGSLEDWGTEEILRSEQDNAANSYILQRETTLIYLKKRVGDSQDVSYPAKELEWGDVETIEVPFGDPQSTIEHRASELWKQLKWKPYDSMLRALAFEDCYRAAMNDKDHVIYLMVPPPELRASETPASLDWIEPPGTPSLQLTIHNPEFVAPPGVAQRLFPLVESTAEVHRDKLRQGGNTKSPKRFGRSFQGKDVAIRKPNTSRLENTFIPGSSSASIPGTLPNLVTEEEKIL